MATISTSYKLPNAEVRDWLKTDDGTDFGSYIVLDFPENCTSTESTSQLNPFDESNITSATKPRAYSSPDIVYNPSDGTVTVQTAGNYFIYFAPLWNTSDGSGSAYSTVFRIKKNGTNVFTSDGMRMAGIAQDPEQVVCHRLSALVAGDQITVSYDSSSSVNCGLVAGTTLILLRVTGHLGGALNTASGSSITSTADLKTFDSAQGGVGTVATVTSGVTFTASGGKFTPSEERLFLNLQSLFYSVGGAVSDISNKFFLDDSPTDHGFMDQMLGGSVASGSPRSHTQQILKAIPANLPIAPVRGLGTSQQFIFEKGTSFSMIDVGNQGSVPSSFLCIVITADGTGSGLSTTEINIYDDDNYGTLTTVDPNDSTNKAVANGAAGVVDATIGGNRGITYDPTGGTFTFSESGDYLVMSNLGSDVISLNNQTCTHRIKKNGVVIALANFFTRSNRDPVTNLLATIAPFNNGDVLTVTGQRSGGTSNIEDGTSIIIVRLGPVQSAAPGFDQLFDGGSNGTGQPIVQTDNTIDSADKGDQRDRRTEQSPFRMTVNGPLTLRGRARSSLPFNVAAGKQGGKK